MKSKQLTRPEELLESNVESAVFHHGHGLNDYLFIRLLLSFLFFFLLFLFFLLLFSYLVLDNMHQKMDLIINDWCSNIRECIRIARLARNDSAQVNRIIDTFAMYGMTRAI
jgi:hypothetical protein